MKPKLEEMEKFSNIIINLVGTDNIGYIDAVTEYCESVGLEIDIAAKLITPFLISKIAEEARNNNLLEKIPVLPI
jgi:predicted amino acid-binding ACT domain protein